MIFADKHSLTLFIFRRDLRLADNIGLIAALRDSVRVIPCFILDPAQCEKNPYKSPAAIQFMLESIEDLQDQLKAINKKLFLFCGDPKEIIEKIIKDKKINAIYLNHDYTPFGKKRDQTIAEICQHHQITLRAFHDALLNPPSATLKVDKTPYQVFSRFYEYVKKLPVIQPQKNTYDNYFNGFISFAEKNTIFEKILPKRQNNLVSQGGRTACLKKLKELKNLADYSNERDYPSKQSTTGLSPYLKFTNCSVREIYYAIKTNIIRSEAILRELYWRDFFTMIAFYFPHVFGHSFQKKYDNLKWENNSKKFIAWCSGKTGFPIVDAGMRELNQTGFMHNRVRLITASFLIKDLHIDWRWGEQYFAQHLIDYDPAVNNGNWQWVASTGTDAQPYFRIFNPWLQQKKFDPDCRYIKKWIPELSQIDKKVIHRWDTISQTLINYPKPIINHSDEANATKSRYAMIIKLSK